MIHRIFPSKKRKPCPYYSLSGQDASAFAQMTQNYQPSNTTFFYPQNGPQLQPGPTPEPSPQPKPQPAPAGAGKGGGKNPPCTGGVPNGSAWKNYEAGGGHLEDHLLYNADAEQQRFDTGNVYSFFENGEIGRNAIEQALSLGGSFTIGVIKQDCERKR
jgi:hypothetical protein